MLRLKSYIECEQIKNILEGEPPTDQSCKVWFILSQWFLRRLKWKKVNDRRRTTSDGKSLRQFSVRCLRWAYKTQSSTNSGWKCFVNFWHVIKRYFLKKTHMIFACFDGYNVLKYQALWLIGTVILSSLDIIFQRKSWLVTSYSPKLDVNGCF